MTWPKRGLSDIVKSFDRIMMEMEEKKKTFTEIIICYNTNDWIKEMEHLGRHPQWTGS